MWFTLQVNKKNFTPSLELEGKPDLAGFGHYHVFVDMDVSSMGMEGGMMSKGGMLGMPLLVALMGCAPPAATTPSAAPAFAAPAASVAPSPAATSVAPLPKPSISPAAVSGTEVKIVEPAFRPVQEWTSWPHEISAKVGTQLSGPTRARCHIP